LTEYGDDPEPEADADDDDGSGNADARNTGVGNGVGTSFGGDGVRESCAAADTGSFVTGRANVGVKLAGTVNGDAGCACFAFFVT